MVSLVSAPLGATFSRASFSISAFVLAPLGARAYLAALVGALIGSMCRNLYQIAGQIERLA
jgi:hypothetical protein